MSERDPLDVGEPEDPERALEDDASGRATVSEDASDEEKAEDEELPPNSGAETMADLDEEAGQTNRPGTERPPV